MPDRPNVLFLMDDEHRPDVLGYAGDDVVRTPTLDRLAETGVVFENAYTPSPACMPARQCMMSGQLPRTCGCETYGDDLPPRSMTFSRRLAQHGYDTVAAGKLHHTGEDKAQGWQTLVGRNGGCNVEPLDGAESHDRPLSTVKWSDAKEIRRAGVGHPDTGWKNRIDEYRVRGAIDYVEDAYLDPHYDRQHPDRPRCLKVSLSQPHYPYLTSESKFQYYLNRVDPYVEDRRYDHPFLGRQHVPVDPSADDGVTPREIRRATAAYYGMIETVDEHFGRVLDTLERAGEDLDEWVIVFCSDHGEMLGQHGVWEKPHFYEPCAGVPLVVRYPERFDAGTVDANVTLCDLFATLCDLANVPLPEEHALDSRSLVPLLEGDRAAWDGRHADEAVSAYGDEVMIKHGDLKYVHVEGERNALFDLGVDPEETANRIDDPDYADEVAEFESRRGELGYGPNGGSGYAGAGYDPGV